MFKYARHDVGVVWCIFAFPARHFHEMHVRGTVVIETLFLGRANVKYLYSSVYGLKGRKMRDRSTDVDGRLGRNILRPF